MQTTPTIEPTDSPTAMGVGDSAPAVESGTHQEPADTGRGASPSPPAEER